MKADIDRLMEEKGVDALLVTGSGRHNPAMVYLTGGAFLNDATLIIKTGMAPVLFHYPMERDEAAKTGLDTIDLTDIGLDEIRRIGSGDPVRTDRLPGMQPCPEQGQCMGRHVLRIPRSPCKPPEGDRPQEKTGQKTEDPFAGGKRPDQKQQRSRKVFLQAWRYQILQGTGRVFFLFRNLQPGAGSGSQPGTGYRG